MSNPFLAGMAFIGALGLAGCPLWQDDDRGSEKSVNAGLGGVEETPPGPTG